MVGCLLGIRLAFKNLPVSVCLFTHLCDLGQNDLTSLGLNFVIKLNDAIAFNFYLIELFWANKTVFVKTFRAFRKKCGFENAWMFLPLSSNPQNSELMVQLPGRPEEDAGAGWRAL